VTGDLFTLLIPRRCTLDLFFMGTVHLIKTVWIALLREQSRTIHTLQEGFIELDAGVGRRR
jgi:hypothetical protein